MISRDKLLEEEHLDKTIESLLGKITEIIIAYKLRDQDTEEAKNIRNIEPRLQQFLNMYKNELNLFKKDTEISSDKRKEIEIKLLEFLKTIIDDLEKYKEEINKMVEKILHNQNINNEYDLIIRIHDAYMKKSQELTSFVHAME
jgi:hypothetical protein